MSCVIRIEAVSKRFGSIAAVDDVSLEIRDNEFLALLGASGCGKTTLLRLLAGLEQPDRGRIFIDGKDVTGDPPFARPVNMMFQSYALFPHMTVAGNVAFGLKQDGLGGAALASRVGEALAAVELDSLGDRKPPELSGGQRQRVALARCLAKRPRVLLLDEPMAALDKHLRERTQRELTSLRERLGITFVVVTHDQGEAMAMADRVAVMDAGRILQIGTPRALYEHPANGGVARFFGDMNIWPAAVGPAPDTLRIAALGIDVSSAISGTAVALRPERIALSRTGADHTVQGVVRDIIYLGTASTYFVEVAAGGTVRVVAQNSDGADVFARGDAVHLSWAAAALTVLTS